ncbi:hypothetical protein ACFL9S_15065 [Erwinia sp. AnSW2-5]|uniref:hypothetical protein n=1 Tax=Erwinia sp. AnSW2-5 TaxID=3367692 RepID=UPI003859584B
MTFGAILPDTEGNPFYINDTMPLCMILKRQLTLDISGGNWASAVVHANDGAVRFLFWDSPNANTYAYYQLNTTTNTWQITASCKSSSVFTVNVYIFGYQYQIPPKWGMAIWDANKNCIITNETKVLRGVAPLGVEGSESAGYNIDTSLVGRWAIAPIITGMIAGIINSGVIRPWSATYYGSSYFNGSSTRITSVPTDTASGGVQNITYYNTRTRIMAVDISNY